MNPEPSDWPRKNRLSGGGKGGRRGGGMGYFGKFKENFQKNKSWSRKVKTGQNMAKRKVKTQLRMRRNVRKVNSVKKIQGKFNRVKSQ